MAAAKEAARKNVEMSSDEARNEAKRLRPVAIPSLPPATEMRLAEELAKSVVILASKS